MSTLAEIEQATETLPVAEQEVLLNFLLSRLRGLPMREPAGGKRVRLPLVPSRHPGASAIGNAEIERFLSE